MIDHDYKIVTREVPKTAHRSKHFIAELRHVFIFIDGNRIVAEYPQQKFSAKTQSAAMIQAGNAFRHWLKQTYPTA